MAMDAVSRYLLAVGIGLGLSSQGFAATRAPFTATQAENGKAVYAESCAQCHGKDMQGSQFAPALVGIPFLQRWAGRSVGELLSFVTTSMPPGNAGTLKPAAYAEIVAYILQAHGEEPGTAPLPADPTALDGMLVPGKGRLEVLAVYPSGGLAPGITLPPWPVPPNPLHRFTPVTDGLLRNPPNGSWLSWRRTQDGVGFSPLAQINRENVRNLRVAWTLSLPAGSNQTTPLVHEGVIFVYSFGDHLQALDAATGDELWRYSHRIPPGGYVVKHRNIALYDDKVYVATSDARVVALEARSGRVVWEQSVGDRKFASATGGPLVAESVVMLGLSAINGSQGYIVGLHAQTGKPLWRFNSIAQSGDPNYDSWNGVPLEKRSGGSVWTAGSYDAESRLAFFGTAPTYDTGPLRNLVRQPGITNDALYTNTTLAIDPRTGTPAWYYQHMANDQWNFDWAFERQVVHLPVGGSMQKLLITAGKEAVYDALNVTTGRYAFSIDLGLQNIITAIDPVTGVKSVDPELVPGNGRRMTVCPNQGGGKNWMPGSYDPTTRILYVPLVESCMDLIPTSKAEGADLTTNVRWTLRPRPGSDGKYGRIHAINLETRKTAWVMRQRAPQTTGVLATAGGVVFAGALDRWFTAYDSGTGWSLWKVRVNHVPNAAPISYLARGKQYIALNVGAVRDGQAATFSPLVPEIREPIESSSAIWVFELPE